MGLLDWMRSKNSTSRASTTSRESLGRVESQFAVVDVETTGLSPQSARVLELAVVMTDRSGTQVWEWSSRFNPQGPVGATHIHGITDADVAGAPPIADSLGYLTQLLAGRVVVAHNANFDLAFLRAEYGRAGWDMPWLPSICTMRAGRAYFPQLPRHRLSDCCEACGVDQHRAHSALSDARATAGILSAFLNRTPDRGAWLEWQDAHFAAGQVRWPTGPSLVHRDYAQPVASPRSARPKVDPPALVRALHDMDMGDALDEGAPDGAVEYLELLAAVFEDGILDETERESLRHLSEALELTDDEVQAAHRAFLFALCHVALSDGKVTRAERLELDGVASALGLDESLVADLVTAAERARLARLSEGARALPDDWSLGEPLRVGDKVVVTGCSAYDRMAIEDRATRLGVRVLGGVSRRVKILVSDGTVDGNKAADARVFGTRVAHPTEFAVLLDYLQPALPVSIKAKPSTVRGTRSEGPGTTDLVRLSPGPAPVPPGVVRAWAREHGHDVGERGRIHSDVIAAYLRVHSVADDS